MKTSSNFYTIHLTGPDMDTRFDLQDESDLELLDLILVKIRKKVLLLSPSSQPTSEHN